MVKTVELTSDEFYIRVSNKTLAYKVDDVRTVLPEDVSSLSIERDKDYVTLATYTPYGINDYRLLVRETRTKYVAEREKSTAKKTVVAGTWISDYAKSIGIRAAFLVVPGVVAAIRRSTAKRDRSREPAVKNLREKQGVSARKLTNRTSIKVQTDSNPNDAA